ncbi:hypothetical protein Tco_0276610 [Tanacetum coccineum]
MHNNIMAAGSKDRPPMLGPGRYSQWRSPFLRYIDTKPNGEGLRKSILSGPYVPSTVLVQVVAATEVYFSEIRRSMESYYSRFYKLMNELTRNNFQVTTMQVNVQFLQQLQPEWSRFVTVVKQSKEIDTISYHTLFDILKQYQNEVNDIHAERIAKNTKGKEIAKPVFLNLIPVSEEDSDPEASSGDKICKRICHSCKVFSKGSTNLPTTTFELLQTPGTRLKIPHQGMQKPKQVKDYMYHKEKMMMCKQAEQGVPLQAEQADWLADTYEEIDEQELEAHYSFMAKIQEVLPEESCSTEHPLEQVQNNDENNMFASKRQHSKNNTVECADERVALANLIANLTLDTEENKTILKQLKKANASLTHELEECKTNLDETSRALGEDLKAQMQDKNIAINELKKLIEKCKGKYVETQFDKLSVV